MKDILVIEDSFSGIKMHIKQDAVRFLSYAKKKKKKNIKIFQEFLEQCRTLNIFMISFNLSIKPEG